ncbi:MAG: hypothetical protein KatS3mg031_0112 [Chitinophagales bacterium]|nr:MAG: hypothetical protein KatS3mg031_0112 [Chitinophagales bacterium]
MKPVLIAWWMFIAGWVTAQIPQGIKYQAVARNESGDILTNQQISIRVSILDSAAGGQSVYSEIHKEGTNAYGLFSIEIGRGLSLMGDFTAISWATGKKWLKVELDPAGGSNYAPMGISELLSVPYAFFAGSALNASGAVEDSTDEL